MALHGKEKIWYVFDRLIDAREETVGNIVGLHPADDLNKHFSHSDFINLMKKLEQEKAAKFISLPTAQTYLKYQIKILPGFDAYHKTLWADPQYREFSRNKYPPKDLEVRNSNTHSNNEIVNQIDSNASTTSDKSSPYTITYSTNRDIILNGLMVLSRPTFNGENDLVFSYLFKNPGKSFSKKEIEEAISQKIAKDFHKIVENLGFKGDLAKMFFSISKNDVMFRNQVSSDDLVRMGISLVHLNKTKAT